MFLLTLSHRFTFQNEFFWFLISCRPLLQDFFVAVAVLSFWLPLRMQPIHSGFACFCWAWPLSLLVLRWFFFGRNANLAGGFAGRRWVVLFVFLGFSAFRGLLLVHGHSVMYISSFYHFYFCQDRPQATSAVPEEKKEIVKEINFDILAWSTFFFYFSITCVIE